jgi:hypothetical protein
VEGKCEVARLDTDKARRRGLVCTRRLRLAQRPAGYRPSLSRTEECGPASLLATGREAGWSVQSQPLEAKSFTVESVIRFSSASSARSGGALKLKQVLPCIRFFSSGEMLLPSFESM